MRLKISSCSCNNSNIMYVIGWLCCEEGSNPLRNRYYYALIEIYLPII